jgi:hypothetical protein
MGINKRLWTEHEKTLAVLDEFDKVVKRLEAKYLVSIKHNILGVKDERKTFKSTPRRPQNQRRR